MGQANKNDDQDANQQGQPTGHADLVKLLAELERIDQGLAGRFRESLAAVCKDISDQLYGCFTIKPTATIRPSEGVVVPADPFEYQALRLRLVVQGTISRIGDYEMALASLGHLFKVNPARVAKGFKNQN
jgi:hypothetical protein